MSAGRTADILASLAAGGPASEWPARLVAQCLVGTRVSGVGLALVGPGGLSGVLATTGAHAQRMEDLQFSLGEGPCVDASRTGRPVLIADLHSEGSHRWPAFTSGATGAGVCAAFTFPLQVGAIRIGVLDLYRTARGPLSNPQVSEALAFADAAVAVLLHLQGRANTEPADDVPDGGTRPPGGRPLRADDGGLAEVVERRAVVHQATGMISVQLDVDLTAALLRLRAHAFATGRPILEVAADVVDRLLVFDDSDDGTTSTSPPDDPTDTGEGVAP